MTHDSEDLYVVLYIGGPVDGELRTSATCGKAIDIPASTAKGAVTHHYIHECVSTETIDRRRIIASRYSHSSRRSDGKRCTTDGRLTKAKPARK